MPVPPGHPEKPEGISGKLMLARMNIGAHEELALWGLSHIGVKPGFWALDIGCGGGANLKRLLSMADNVHVMGVDYSPVAVEMSRDINAEAIECGLCGVVEGNVSCLPFGENAFDVATAFETVYFWPDIEQSLAEVCRVLKPGGQFLVCNEANGKTEEANKIAEEIDCMTIYSAADLCVLLEYAGFNVVAVDDEGETGRMCVVACVR